MGSGSSVGSGTGGSRTPAEDAQNLVLTIPDDPTTVLPTTIVDGTTTTTTTGTTTTP